MSRGWFSDLPRKPFACFDLEVEKSICVQRLGVASSTFLHDRQTCVIVTRGSFMGKWRCDSHVSFSRVKKRGIRTRMSFGNRFTGCRIDSSERSFGRTVVSNEFLTAVIYKHSRESSVTTKMPSGRLILAHLRNFYAVQFAVSNHFVSARFTSIAFMAVYGMYLKSSRYLSNCPSNNWRS